MITKLRFKFQLWFYFLKKNFIFLFLGITLGSFGFINQQKILSFINSPRFHPKVIGIEGLYTTSNLPKVISQQISSGLTTTGLNNRPDVSPIVASMDIQNDNQSYIFDLKPNLTWHNGKKLTAYDIKYEINGIKLEPISATRLKITLDSPFSPILTTLSKPIMLDNLIGVGDYKVNKLVTKEGYLKSMSLKPRTDQLPPLIYKFYNNEKELITAFQLGEIDEMQIESLPTNFSESKNITITKEVQADNKYLAIFLNTNKIASKQQRQALAYATPKTNDRNERCLGPLSPTSWAYNPSVKEYTYNSSKALELAKDYPLEPIKLTVIDPDLLDTAQQIKQSWEKSLQTKVEVSVESNIDAENFDAILAYGAIPTDPDQYLYWHSTQLKTNITKLNNERIDALLEEGRKTYDYQERKRIYQDFQRFLLEESPAIFISYPTVYTITRT